MKRRSTFPEKAGLFFDRILDFFFVLAGILLAFSALSVAMAIVSRYFFNRPWGWVVEISEYILLYITFLVSARVLKKSVRNQYHHFDHLHRGLSHSYLLRSQGHLGSLPDQGLHLHDVQFPQVYLYHGYLHR
jgi:hypothetical protein